MILERAELLIKEGMEEEFAAVMTAQGLPLLAGFPGVHSARVGRGVENPGKFILLVEWDALATHTAFKGSPSYPKLGAVLGPFSKGGSMEHFDLG